jgi:hypothetical protein
MTFFKNKMHLHESHFNNSEDRIFRIFIEPSTDQFFLNPEDKLILKINTTSNEIPSFDLHTDYMVIWIPSKSKINILINNIEQYVLYNEFEW